MQSNNSSAQRGATQPVRLVQMGRRRGDSVDLVVQVEGVEAPHLRDVQMHTKAARLVVGRFKPVRRFVFEVQPGFTLSITQTETGVEVVLTCADTSRAGQWLTADQAWHWYTRRVDVWWQWWNDVQACTWGDEAPEVAA